MRPSLLLIALLLATGCDSTNPTLNTPSPQPPTDSFELVFGTENYDEGRALIQTSNGDLLVAGGGNGVVAPADGTLPTPSLWRISPEGDVRWSRVFDEHRYGTAIAIAETTPEEFVLLTEQHNDFFGQRYLTLFKFNGSQLTPLYKREGAFDYDATHPLLVTSDGGFLLIGMERSREGPKIAFVVRLDAAGNERWGHLMQGRVVFHATVATNDGGFVVLGSDTVSLRPYERQILLLRFDANGTLRWNRRFDASGKELRTIASADDGGFLLAGTQHGSGGDDLLVLSVDSNGRLRNETSHTLPSNSQLQVRALAPTESGGVIAAGWLGTGQSSAAFALKRSSSGDLVWVRTFSKANTYTKALDIVTLADGHIAVAGTRGPNIPSYGGSDFDTLVLVLDQDGTLTGQ